VCTIVFLSSEFPVIFLNPEIEFSSYVVLLVFRVLPLFPILSHNNIPYVKNFVGTNKLNTTS